MPKMFDSIDKNSIVKAGSEGYYYCCTIPPHPYGETRGDRKKKYVYLHRATMEKKLGRYLKKNEQVDHKDKDRSNNSPSNLVMKESGPHQKDHAKTNHFWKKSPRTQKRKAQRVITAFLEKI